LRAPQNPRSIASSWIGARVTQAVKTRKEYHLLQPNYAHCQYAWVCPAHGNVALGGRRLKAEQRLAAK